MCFSLFVCVHIAEKKPQKIKTHCDYLSDSESSEDEVNPHLRTSQEERLYGTVKGSMQVTQVALSHNTVQCKPVTTAFISDDVCIPTEKVGCLQVTSQLQEFLSHFPLQRKGF